MAVRKKADTGNRKTQTKAKSGAKRRIQPWVLITALVLVMAFTGTLVWFVGFYAPSQLFEKNKHFALRKVVINSEYWSKSTPELMKKLNIRYGESLFKLDLKSIRERLLKINPNYQPQVYIRIPDTLEIRIVESSPTARIKTQQTVKKNGRLRINAHLALDENGNVINLQHLGLEKLQLPVISGLPEKFDKSLTLPAVWLLETVVSRYPDIEILEISVQKKTVLEFVFIWRRQFRFKAQFAADDPDFAQRVNALQNQILHEGRNNSGNNFFNLCEPGRIYSGFDNI